MAIPRAQRLLLLVPLLAGCASPPPPVATTSPPPVAVVASPSGFVVSRPSSVIGTPFLLAMKISGCAISIGVAGPVAALYALADQGVIPPEQDLRADVDRALDVYCGPPYVVPP